MNHWLSFGIGRSPPANRAGSAPAGNALRRLGCLQSLRRGGALLLAAAALLGGATCCHAEAFAASGETTEQTICRLIETSARSEQLPIDFFTRLIWRESSFRPGVTSPAGAQGIAQFMPGTAAERGLEDPFDPETAIPASANYLAALRARFGNLGLAAAAYNAGPNRLSRWLADGGYLPFETEQYVLFVTGRPVGDWAAIGPGTGDDAQKGFIYAERPPKGASAIRCATIVAAVRKSAPQIYDGVYAPFGVQLSGNFSKSRAIATYERQVARFPSLLAGRPTLILGSRAPGRGRRAFYRVRLPEKTLREANAFCRDLKRAGGHCVVLRN